MDELQDSNPVQTAEQSEASLAIDKFISSYKDVLEQHMKEVDEGVKHLLHIYDDGLKFIQSSRSFSDKQRNRMFSLLDKLANFLDQI